MHELSIAQAIVDSVRQQPALVEGQRLVSVGVRVGEISGVDPDALAFAFEVIVQGTDFEKVSLAIERVPLRHRCTACGHEFQVVGYDPTCPACGAGDTRGTAGDELAIAYLELE